MDKDEILRKSREENEDEGLTHVGNVGRGYGFIGLTVMFTAYAITVLFFDAAILPVPMSLWCAYTGAECLGKYKASSKKSELFAGVILCFAAVVFFLRYLFY